ncbi:hypothetical protein [Streptomyces sp. Ac-502]|uniref:hypothetical protein n=1 Tax=Streptomyces sp. Ac-502 TaxID=3342801 RepID=UPI003862B45F
MDRPDALIPGHGPGRLPSRGGSGSGRRPGATRRYRLAGFSLHLAAGRADTAQRLLWEALAASDGRILVNCITAPNEWAVDVGLAAGLAIGQEGYIAVRGLPGPAPYLADGRFL